MEVFFSEKAEKELDEMDKKLRLLFLKHAEKMAKIPPRKHLKFGLPFNVENVTKQSRIVYGREGGKIYILHCFKTHKDYEKWYKSFK